MVSKAFFEALDALALDRGLEKEAILDLLSKGILNAYKKENLASETAVVEFNEERAEIVLKVEYVVTETPEEAHEISLEQAKEYRKKPKIGDVIIVRETPKDFGRIAISTAKQILNQGLKQLEREKAYNLFKDRENEMITATILNANAEYVTLDCGNGVETSLPKKELLDGDSTAVGTRLRVYITKVEWMSKGAKIFVSRKDKALVKRLIESFVPEVMDGTVEIMGLSRAAGERCKVCVHSHDENVDPVGAVVGVKGSRIKEVLLYLAGEKIDIYQYSDDPIKLICNALEPAKILGLNLNSKEKAATVIVNDKDLTATIGAKGQNTRLASQSSGWKMDVKSITTAKEMGLSFEVINPNEKTT
jgi:N utilization substance protein A